MNGTAGIDYQSWTDPVTGFVVEYSLAAFYDLEFSISEGFRRIPHGGIETGALLIGSRTETGVRIDAFRPIECEHAFGPSFQLSDRDVAKLREQIAGIARDRELAGATAVGWCIAHTRSDLALNAREARLFDELFPEPRQLTMIAKPERFKPTRFAFFVRDDQSGLMANAGESTMILPAPPRNGKRSTQGSESAPVGPSQPLAREKPAFVAAIPEPRPVAPQEPSPVREPEVAPDTAEEPTAQSSGALPAPPITNAAEPFLPPLPKRERLRTESRAQAPMLAWWLTGAALIMAALAAYGFYLRLALASVPLSLTPHGAAAIVSWPPAATRDADAASVRINTGDSVPLSASEKQSGNYALNVSGGDIVVELDVQHWYGTTRGTIRYLASPSPSPAPANPHPSSAPASPGP